MRKIDRMRLFLMVIMITLISCKYQPKNDIKSDQENKPKFVIYSENHNFGKLNSGDVISFSFKFENKGTGLLSIDSVVTDCGCIQVKYSDQYYKSNEIGYIEVVYNSAGDWGNIFKQIEIYTNSAEKKRNISIGAYVENQLFN